MGFSYKHIEQFVPFLKWRLYRFDSNLYNHIVAECLERKWRLEQTFHPKTLELISKTLEAQNQNGQVIFEGEKISSLEGFEPEKIYGQRASLINSDIEQSVSSPKRIISIIGAPRSGTSYLYYLLTYFSNCAVFTDASHHLWSLLTLNELSKYFIRKQPETILQLRTRKLRLDRRYSHPSEAENILHRAIPVYRHLRGHEYEIINPTIENAWLLRKNVSDHLNYFKTDTLLIKSPFNTFRIEALANVFPKAEFINIHIFRNGYLTALSMEENHFLYWWNGQKLSSEESWINFVNKCLEASPNKLIHLHYDNLVSNPKETLEKLSSQIEVDFAEKTSNFSNFKYKFPQKPLPKCNNEAIDKLNLRLVQVAAFS